MGCAISPGWSSDGPFPGRARPAAGRGHRPALMGRLAGRCPRFAEALADPGVVRFAVNQEYAGRPHAGPPGDEVALFPPVTGG